MQANIDANASENILTIAASCQIAENATEDDVKGLLAGDLPETRTSKCLHACVQESIGLVGFTSQFFHCVYH